MKQKTLAIVVLIMLMPMWLFGQDYKSLWKQVDQAVDKDLPQSAIEHLATIERKAQKESAYGQLLKAVLYQARLKSEVSPDSLAPAVQRLDQLLKKEKNVALRAVYATVLYSIYHENHSLSDEWESLCDNYRTIALSSPQELGKVKSTVYKPFVVSEIDSQVYDDDLLHVIGRELEAWQWMNDYYEKTGNRRASCLTSLEVLGSAKGDDMEKLQESAYLRKLDSLITKYADLDVAGEVVLARYSYMENHTTATVEEKMAYLDWAIAKWGNWKRIAQLKNNRTQLVTSKFMVDIPAYVQMPNHAQTVKLRGLRHLSSLSMKVYRTRLAGNHRKSIYYEKDLKEVMKDAVEVKEAARRRVFPAYQEYEEFEDSFQLAGLPNGVYLLEFTTDPQTEVARVLYYVTNLRVLALGRQEANVRYIVVNAETGKPVKGAKVRVESSAYNDKANKLTLTTNANGETMHTFTSGTWHSIYVSTADDTACPPVNSGDNFNFSPDKSRREYTRIYTDRAIYRPGQTVQMAAVIYAVGNYIESSAVAGKAVVARLRDANYKTIAEQNLVTDEYGKCSAAFTLPVGLKNGNFTILVNSSSQSFKVEEYKRPTFELSFSDYKESYKAGDTITVQGKAVSYAGVPVQDAKVQYTVCRRVAYWWMSYSWYWGGGYYGHGTDSEELYTGEATTKEDGSFDMRMPMLLPEGNGRYPMFYNFVVEADVTDQAGETHSGTMSLPLGTKATALTCSVSQRIRIDELSPVTFNRSNAAGNPIAGTVRYRLDGGAWKTCTANTPQAVLDTNMKSGEHRLEAICEDDSVDVKFVIFSLDDKKPAMETKDWFYVSHSTFPDNKQPVTVQVGSSEPDLYIAYEILADGKVKEEGFIRESSSLWNKKFTYKEEYGNGLTLAFAWVKNGISYHHTTSISRPVPDKELQLVWETFRDRLKPGQKEEWRLSIKDKAGNPVTAQLMAVLYDKSLDQLASHHWSLYPNMWVPQASVSWTTMSFGGLSTQGKKHVSLLSVPVLYFSHFNHDVYPSNYYAFGRGFRDGRVLMRANASANGVVMLESAMAEPMMLEEKTVVEAKKAGGENKEEDASADVAGEQKEESVQLRENMQETAFFYSALTADVDGNVILSFTLPESLTTWRFMGVAHTTDMMTGSLTGETIAQKDVMIQPNMPRFVRMGDKAQFSARIFNISEQAQQGIARIELLDPETEMVAYSDQQAFAVEAGNTGHVTFSFQPDEKYSLLICRMSAKGDNFSDGEQHYLPVLPDKERVTKTVPFTQHEPGVKAVDLTKLFPAGTTQQKLTVEYTNNPAWLMVQSLATLGQPRETSAIDQAASYYSNLLAKTILAQTPNAKNVFEQWRREQGDATSLQSNLSKDEELKDIILAETPWVNDADREEEQKQRLADFFDENMISNRLSAALEKLAKLQQADGAFTWYPEMPGSPYITMSVAEMLARLRMMTGDDKDTERMLSKAMNFMDQEVIDIVREMRKWEKKGVKPSFPTFTALRWLYVNAISGRELSGKAADAQNYLMPLLKKDIKRQTIYEKAMTAIILQQYGDQKTAKEYVRSLKEFTVFTEEMGRYYDTPRAGYSWYSYKIPTEVAAIEAIRYVDPSETQTVNEMRRWLLQEKRSQMWDTPINSVNAIYAFLFDQPNLLANQEPSVLAIDQKAITLSRETAGIGYVKTAIQEPEGREFTATKTSTGTSWGALYAQFMQKTSEVEASQSGITVVRELLSEKGKKLTELKVGDRVKVRITITSTRDLDFVQVLDRRAACMEPVRQLSGYHNGAYCSPKDFSTNYYYHGISKGKHVLETEYYIDRAGVYETGTCTVQCAYSPEYRATAKSVRLSVEK